MSVDQPASSNIQEHQRLLAALRESEILRELAELLTSSLDLNHILQVLVKRTTEVCQIERCAVWLLDDTRNLLRPATYHLSSQQLNSHVIIAADHIWNHSSLPFADPVVQRGRVDRDQPPPAGNALLLPQRRRRPALLRASRLRRLCHRVGPLSYEPGDYVLLPKRSTFRLMPDE